MASATATYSKPFTAAVMVTYQRFPYLESLQAALRSVDFLVLVDNGSDKEIVDALRRFAHDHSPKCILIENGANLGISRAYNIAVARLDELGVSWFYFLDHDAIFNEALFSDAKALWHQLVDSGVHVGMVVPIVSDDSSTYLTRLHFRSRYTTVRSAITSGILTNHDVFSGANGFNEAVFADGADIDLTTRVRRLGYEIVRMNRVLIIQDFENRPDVANGAIRALDWANRMRSLVRVAIGHANIYRTRSSVFNSVRQATMESGLLYIERNTPGARVDMKLVRFLNSLEKATIQVICKVVGEGP